MATSGLLSIILLSYYSKERIVKSYEAISQLLAKEQIPFEFIVMDDGSKDESYQIAIRLEHQHENVRAYRLSKNYGSMYSTFAGLSVSMGDCVLPIVDDEQQPYTTIVQMYRVWQNGEKIIIPYRNRRDDPKLSVFFSNAFYKVMNCISDITYPSGGADLALLDREVVDILNTRIHPRNTMFMAEVLNLGFTPYFLPYERPLGLNGGRSRWTFKKKVRLGLDTMFSNTTFPLRMISYLGLTISMLSFLGIIFYAYIAIWGNREFWNIKVPGWISIVLLMFLLGGVILLSLGIISEYLWRIYDETKDRPGYIIRKDNR